MSTDPRETLSGAPMSTLQMTAVAVTVGLTALDGFDVLSISFAAPGIAAEWGIDRAALGIVLSMELFGMALGALVLGAMADRIGRRPTMLACLALMTLGMFMVTGVQQIAGLEIWRFTTGSGSRPARHCERGRSRVLQPAPPQPECCIDGRRLSHRRGGRRVHCQSPAPRPRLARGVLSRSIGHRDLHPPAAVRRSRIRSLARPAATRECAATNQQSAHSHGPCCNRRATASTGSGAQARARRSLLTGVRLTTILCALACFFHMMTFYFMLKWIPKIVADMHFPATAAAGVLVWANVGGATGGAVLGILSQRIGLKPLTLGVMLLSTVMVILFGHAGANLNELSVLCAAAGFFTNGGIVGPVCHLRAGVFQHTCAPLAPVSQSASGAAARRWGPSRQAICFTWGYTLPSVATFIALGSFAGGGRPGAPAAQFSVAIHHLV